MSALDDFVSGAWGYLDEDTAEAVRGILNTRTIDDTERYVRIGKFLSGNAKSNGNGALHALVAEIGRRAETERAADIIPEPVIMLYAPYIPTKAPTLIVGQPGEGKTTLGLGIVADATRGLLPGDYCGKPITVLVWSGEDPTATVLVPRLRAAGADLERVHFVKMLYDGLEDGLALPNDLEYVEHAITETGAELFFLDPIMAAIADSIDAHKDHSMRRALAPIFRLADRTGIAVLAVAHTNKATTGDFIQRVGGSVGLTAAVRSAMLVARDPEKPDDDAARVLVHGKSNLSIPAPTRRFAVISATIDTDPPISTSKIFWGEDAPHLTAAVVLRGPESERPTPKLDAARELLRDELAEGPVLKSTLETLARQRDIGWRTVESAKLELGVIVEQIPVPGVRGPGPARWSLPPTEEDDDEANTSQPNTSQSLTASPDCEPLSTPQPAPVVESEAPKAMVRNPYETSTDHCGALLDQADELNDNLAADLARAIDLAERALDAHPHDDEDD